jgi:hypothetical protein
VCLFRLAYYAGSTVAHVPYEWEEWAMLALAGIEPYEVRQVLEAARRWPRPGADSSGTRVFTVWGRTRAGRALIVAVYQVSGFTWKIVGARDMTKAELAELARWEETR